MKFLSYVTILLTFLSSLSTSFASSDNQGIDDWDSEQVEKFFKAQGIPVPENFLASLKAKGINTGVEGLHLSDDQLTDLGIDNKSIPKYQTAAKSKIDAVKKNPVDLFEWRSLNRRLCDFWIIPMMMNPTVGLLWARFNEHSDVIEKQDDEIDHLTTRDFWLTWFICPSRPFWLTAKNFASVTFVDDVSSWSLFFAMFSECLGILAVLRYLMFGDFPTALSILRNRLVFPIFNFLVTCVSYYILYWVIPNFVEDIWFYSTIYVIMPIIILSQIFLALGAFCVVVPVTGRHPDEFERQLSAFLRQFDKDKLN